MGLASHLERRAFAIEALLVGFAHNNSNGIQSVKTGRLLGLGPVLLAGDNGEARGSINGGGLVERADATRSQPAGLTFQAASRAWERVKNAFLSSWISLISFDGMSGAMTGKEEGRGLWLRE